MSKRTHDTHKYYYEYRALYTLEHLFPEKFRSLMHSDSPDLVTSDNSIGIEVVRAVSNKNEQAFAFFEKELKGKRVDEVPQNKLNRFTETNLPLVYEDKIFGFSPVCGVWHNTRLLQHAVASKVKKLDGYSGRASKLELYVFTDTFEDYEVDEIKQLVEILKAAQHSSEFQFTTLYVDDCGWFYQCDLLNDKIEFFETKSYLRSICQSAKDAATIGG
ncbi:MAG: hypothetical protein IJE08_04200 [Clostridia bacterium]|nr:hypothetical protein [Clostridia bacterium]